MRCSRGAPSRSLPAWLPVWVAVLAGAIPASAAPPNLASAITPFSKPKASAEPLPLDQLAPAHRDAVRQVMAKSTLSAKGPAESFFGSHEHYRWLLDNPDRGVAAWRKIGAKCVSINPLGNGRFGWTDDQGSEVAWQAVHSGPSLRLWLAEGKVKPGPLMPAVPVKALVVLRHTSSQSIDGASVVHHQSDLYVQTDSKTAALMTRMLGPSAQRVAEHGMGQLQFFFSGLCWYLERHPDEVDELLKTAE